MDSPDEKQGASAPEGSVAPAQEPGSGEAAGEWGKNAPHTEEAVVSYSQTVDNGYSDGYPSEESRALVKTEDPGPESAGAPSGPGSPPPPGPPASPEDEDDEGMLRMSFLEHLEELRTRIFRGLIGVGVAFILSLSFSNQLWMIVRAPAVDALRQLGFENPTLTQITPMEVFNIVWMKLPILTAIFLSSPWILYQVWAFIAPGLYKRERRWAAPFVICSAGLFILGGLFAYHVAFRYGLVFLLGLGRDLSITPMVSVSEYFDLFVNVTLGVSLVFELPVLVFFLTLLRVTSPAFLLRNSRYAILIIVALAAIITPTPDVFNLMLFATPMCVLFYVGVFASYLLVLHREERRFPWGKVILGALVALTLAGGAVWLAIARYGYHLERQWPFLLR